MTEQSLPPKMSLTDALSKVQVTSSQAIALLNGLSDGHSDRDPDLVAAINKAIGDLQGGTTTAAKEEEHTTSGATRSR